MSIQQMLVGVSGGGDVVYVEDVFSVDLWEGTGNTHSITNGLDLSGEGGLVWTKVRDWGDHHWLTNTDFPRSATAPQAYDGLATSYNYPLGYDNNFGITSFNDNGFSIGGSNIMFNGNGYDYVSWSFRKAPGFFDVVNYTGTGSNQDVAHNLGSAPGMVIVKCTTHDDEWFVYHKDLDSTSPDNYNLRMRKNARQLNTTVWNGQPTSTHLKVGPYSDVNGVIEGVGKSYTAYIFANDDEQFGDSQNESIIACGSYSSTGFVDLGWEPQWIMTKSIDNTNNYKGEWRVIDTERGIAQNADDNQLFPGDDKLENTTSFAQIAYVNSTGFTVESEGNYGSWTVYIAIRKPMNN